MLRVSFYLFVSTVFVSLPLSADETKTEPFAEISARNDAFSKKLSGAVLVGQFTVDGKEDENPIRERYEIKSVTKMPEGDYWLFKARIKYGDKDLTVPMPLIVKWAGKTPMITLDKVAIPTMGTFDAKVVIDGDRYAGTWQHDAVGGHMFGKIERAKPAKKKDSSTAVGAAVEDSSETRDGEKGSD